VQVADVQDVDVGVRAADATANEERPPVEGQSQLVACLGVALKFNPIEDRV
jgi:hypothetical protein